MTEKRDESRDRWIVRSDTGECCIRMPPKECPFPVTYMVHASELESVTRERDAAVRRVAEALDVIERFGGIDGDHHKTWVIDQAVRALTGNGYAQWVKEQCDGEDGPNTYDWDEGIPP